MVRSEQNRAKQPLLYPGTDLPFLLDLGDLTEIIPANSEAKLNRFRNRMDTVLIGPRDGSRTPTFRQLGGKRLRTNRQPAPYVLGLANAIADHPERQPARVATAYMTTNDAKDRIREGRKHFSDMLDARTAAGFIYSRSVASLLNMYPNVVYDWCVTGVVGPDEVIRVPGKTRPELHVARAAVERLCEWRLPEGLRETGVPDLPYPPEEFSPEL